MEIWNGWKRLENGWYYGNRIIFAESVWMTFCQMENIKYNKIAGDEWFHWMQSRVLLLLSLPTMHHFAEAVQILILLSFKYTSINDGRIFYQTLTGMNACLTLPDMLQDMMCSSLTADCTCLVPGSSHQSTVSQPTFWPLKYRYIIRLCKQT